MPMMPFDFPTPTIQPDSISEYTPHTYGQGAIRDIILVRNGKRLQSLESDPFVTYDADADYSIEAYTTDTTGRVHFHVYDHNDNKVLVEQLQVREKNESNEEGRLYLFGWDDNVSAPFPWKDVQRNHLLVVTISAVDRRRFDIDRVYLQFS